MSQFDSIDIHIQRSPHVTATDFDFLDSMVRDSRFHIYAPELDGADESVLEGMRQLAKGDSKVYQDVMSRTDKSSAWSKSFSALFMIRKPIESFDVSAEQHQANEIFRNYGRVVTDVSSMTSNQLIDSMPAQLERLPNFITARDTVIAANVIERLPNLIESNQKLKNLGKVGLLMTIGDNHRLVDSLLEEAGFVVTKNDIPVTGAHEKAGLMQLEARTPSENEVIEATAYSLLRSFVTHDSTYELRNQLNAFVQGFDESEVASLMVVIKQYGVDGVKYVMTEQLKHLGIDTDLTFITPGSQAQPIKPKETYERRNGMMGIRTSVF